MVFTLLNHENLPCRLVLDVCFRVRMDVWGCLDSYFYLQEELSYLEPVIIFTKSDPNSITMLIFCIQLEVHLSFELITIFFMQDNWPSVLFAMAGGVVLSIGNLSTQYAWAFVGLSVVEVVTSSITVVIGNNTYPYSI